MSVEEEYVDADGYPTEYAIERMLNCEGTPRQFVDFVSSMWWMDLTSFKRDLEASEPCYRWSLATGGWSGNETIISEMRETFFYMNFWAVARRGGGFDFEIPLDRIDERSFWGHWERWKKPADALE